LSNLGIFSRLLARYLFQFVESSGRHLQCTIIYSMIFAPICVHMRISIYNEYCNLHTWVALQVICAELSPVDCKKTSSLAPRTGAQSDVNAFPSLGSNTSTINTHERLRSLIGTPHSTCSGDSAKYIMFPRSGCHYAGRRSMHHLPRSVKEALQIIPRVLTIDSKYTFDAAVLYKGLKIGLASAMDCNEQIRLSSGRRGQNRPHQRRAKRGHSVLQQCLPHPGPENHGPSHAKAI
jgi:hypothetical protein